MLTKEQSDWLAKIIGANKNPETDDRKGEGAASRPGEDLESGLVGSDGVRAGSESHLAQAEHVDPKRSKVGSISSATDPSVAQFKAPDASLNGQGSKPTKTIKTLQGDFTYYADRESDLSPMLGPTLKLYDTAYRLRLQVDKTWAETDQATKTLPSNEDAVKEVNTVDDPSLSNAAIGFELAKKTLDTFQDQFGLFEADLENAGSQIKIAQLELDAQKKDEEAEKAKEQAELFDTIFKTIGDIAAMANPLHDAIKAPEKLLDAIAPFLDAIVPQINALKQNAARLQAEAKEIRQKKAIDSLAAAQTHFDKMEKIIPKLKGDMTSMVPLIKRVYVNNEKQYDQIAAKDKAKKFRFKDLSAALQVASNCARLCQQTQPAAYAAYDAVKKLAGVVIGTNPEGNPDYIPPPAQADSMVTIGKLFSESKRLLDQSIPMHKEADRILKALEDTRDSTHAALSRTS